MRHVTHPWTHLRRCALLLGVALTLTGASLRAAQDQEPSFEEKMRLELETLYEEAKEGSAPHQNRLGSLYLVGNEILRPDAAKAVHWFQEAANQGHAMAQFNLGLCYDRAIGVPKRDVYQALEWYQKAADQGLVVAQRNTGFLYKEIQRPADAFHYFQEGSRGGDMISTRELGIAYLDGRGVESDMKRGVSYLERAANVGDITANLKLAEVYSGEIYPVAKARDVLDAEDTSQMTDDAFLAYTRRRVEERREAAEAELEKHVDKADVPLYADAELMFSYLWRAAGQNSAEAMAKVAYCLDNGIGTGRNPGMAVEWYSRAAELNYPQAMVNLGEMYASGRHVRKNPETAFRYFTDAANQNFAPGMHNVGVCHFYGSGTAEDQVAAAEYFSRAAKAGYAPSQFRMGLCYETGAGLQANPQLALYWYRQAANQGNSEAMISLAMLYLEGRGVPADSKKARSYLVRARIAGHPEADRLLDELF